MSGTSYKAAGVDIDAGNETVRRIKSIARSTFTPGVLSEIGSFGGLFSLGGGWSDPVLVSSADGVGTKLKVAFMAGVHDTIGQDLVAMCAVAHLCGMRVSCQSPLISTIWCARVRTHRC